MFRVGSLPLYETRRRLAEGHWPSYRLSVTGSGWRDEDLTLADRMFRCQNPQVPCGLVLDRDLNAAINLSTLAESSSERRNACGEGSAGWDHIVPVKLPSLKQKPNIV